jgi:hypothetical protein
MENKAPQQNAYVLGVGVTKFMSVQHSPIPYLVHSVLICRQQQAPSDAELC